MCASQFSRYFMCILSFNLHNDTISSYDWSLPVRVCHLSKAIFLSQVPEPPCLAALLGLCHLSTFILVSLRHWKAVLAQSLVGSLFSAELFSFWLLWSWRPKQSALVPINCFAFFLFTSLHFWIDFFCLWVYSALIFYFSEIVKWMRTVKGRR